MDDHTYCSAQEQAAEPESPSPKRRKCQEVKRNRDRRRQKTRVNIGVAFPRWKSLMREKCFQNDSEVACFLLHSDEQVTAEAAEAPGMEQRIDWAEDGSPLYQPKDGAEDNDSSDDECHPSICIRCVSVFTLLVSSACLQCPHTFTFMLRLHRMGGALQQAPSIDRLPVIGIDETVHDQPAYEEPPDEPPPPSQDPALPGPQQVLSEENLIGAKASIVYEDCLRQLASFLVLPVEKCSGRVKTGEMCDCVSPFEINITYKGTAASVEWICPNGHSVWSWSSQPVMNFGMQAGDFLLSTNILLSGNNYAKVALLFNFMNMGMVSKNTFYSVQGSYCVDTIKEFWEERRTEAISRLRGKDVMVLADGRNDSPGHGAQYCSYITMENETKEVIHVATVEKRQTSWNSVVMEKEGFIESVDKLTSEIKLVEICTDANALIGSLMNPGEGRYKALEIHHSLDVWHGAKSLAKKISAAAKKKGQSILLTWLKDIVNHFWWCCKTADTTQQFLTLWVSIIHHICNIHTWSKGSCHHGHLEDTRGRSWIQKGTRCHKALLEIVVNKRWLKDIHKYLRFRSTADLETFQNHILMYANKRYTFSSAVYEARVLLAALDYNFHRNRPTVKTVDGKEILRRLYKKNGRRYSVYALRCEKSYEYISDLQARIVKRRLTSEEQGRSRFQPSEPRGLGWVVPLPAPSTSILVRTVKRCVVLPADVQQVLVGDVALPEGNPSWEEEPEPSHIKEEEEEVCVSQEEEHPDGQMEADIDRFLLSAASVKSEDDEEELSPLHQSQTEDNRSAEPRASSSAMEVKTESDAEDCGGPEPARNLDPDHHSQPNTDEKDSDSDTDISEEKWYGSLSESDPEDSDSVWKETLAPEFGVNAPKYKDPPVSDVSTRRLFRDT
ncbi:hypothetical protein GBF38_010482 [Nibea albiflora]|uniref:Uncharacterized protein n=1 Tax=Nibea albiflora TaxID=240163 RepID=A0ACB7F726_NIBAL|nr:hypothetical protein GBF38_010482 [Nibea albiflora]